MRTGIFVGLAVLQLGAAPIPVLSAPVLRGAQAQQCPVPEVALRGVCDDVRARSIRAEDKVEAAACVLPSDSPEVMQTKVQALFRDHMPRCNGFNVSRGNILKYAVAYRTYDFLYTAANKWRVDLNVADETDGRTVLDYVEDQIPSNVGRPAYGDLIAYREMLIRAGARTTAQLEGGEGCRPSTRCREGSR